MKKIGFTLAELLITLGIIGIITALTIPSLSTSVQKKYWANALASQITDFENAMQDMMMRESIINVTESKAWQESPEGNFKNIFKENFQIAESIIDKKFSEYYKNKVYNIDKSIFDSTVEDEELTGFKLKNSGIIFINNEKGEIKDNALELGVDFSQLAGTVVIDINAKNSPNTIGRDIFHFNIDEYGRLKALGGTELSLFFGNNNRHWSSYCKKNNIVSSASCTGRLVENNFVMDY